MRVLKVSDRGSSGKKQDPYSGWNENASPIGLCLNIRCLAGETVENSVAGLAGGGVSLEVRLDFSKALGLLI